jgi:uncharacterized membrane protein YvbJ
MTDHKEATRRRKIPRFSILAFAAVVFLIILLGVYVWR